MARKNNAGFSKFADVIILEIPTPLMSSNVSILQPPPPLKSADVLYGWSLSVMTLFKTERCLILKSESNFLSPLFPSTCP